VKGNGMATSLLKALFFILFVLLLRPIPAGAQTVQTAAGSPPIAQPLIREGDFAIDLAQALSFGPATSEAEAERTLISVGISPRNGWISDYPVTPDIVGEVRDSVGEAADGGKLHMGKDAAVAALQAIINGYNMPVRAMEGQGPGETSGSNYPPTTVINNYYTSEGPPVVTYYAPPPDYAYLYTWVPYPFWGWDIWFPGFFVLVDFDVRVHGYRHRHGRERENGEFISNHFRDPRTNTISRIDPTNRHPGGTFAEPGRRGIETSPRQDAPSSHERKETYKQYRGYGVFSRPSAPDRSSAFERSDSTQFEHAASDRGYQSRSRAGQIPAPSSSGGKVSRGGTYSRGGSGGYNGSGRGGGRFR
jgi:hypothetical protein